MPSVLAPSLSRPVRPASGALPVMALAALLTGMAGCSAKGPTLGDEIDAAGAMYASIGERWQDGEDKTTKGRKLVSRGRERVRDGEDDIERGERLIRDGERDMASSRREFERLKALAPTTAVPPPGG